MSTEVIWKDIPGYEGLYQVSNDGRIYSLTSNRELSVIQKGDGYTCISLCDKNRVKKQYRIHQLVAKAFIPNPDNLPMINHKNEIKNDNRVENLEWVTAKQNSSYGTRPQRVSEKMKGVPKSRESVEKRLATMKEKLANMTPEERSAMFGREWTDEKRIAFAEAHKRENLKEETLLKMREAKLGKSRDREAVEKGIESRMEFYRNARMIEELIGNNDNFITPHDLNDKVYNIDCGEFLCSSNYQVL